MNRKISGFSLIEMAIVLVIVGLVGGIALPGLKVMVDRQKASITAERQEKILYALSSYALTMGCLPNAASEKDLSGTEDKKNQLCRGIVPYHDLGLPESFAKDGYHHWFTYVVEKKYTEAPTKIEPRTEKEQREKSFCRFVKKPVENRNNLEPTLEITLSHGQVIPIAVAVISHGSEGRGALNSLTPPHEGDEGRNTEGMMLVDRPISQDPQKLFSHKVVWATAQNLVGVYGHAPCPPERLPEIPETGSAGGQPASGTKTERHPLQPQDQVLLEQKGEHVTGQQEKDNGEIDLKVFRPGDVAGDDTEYRGVRF